MAKRDTLLDSKIVTSAKREFLIHGYQNASLHKIAKNAQVTTGALYTRYDNKDDLFKCIVKDALLECTDQFIEVQTKYIYAKEQRDLNAFLEALTFESNVYLNLFDTHHDACVLLFCKSDGSSLGSSLFQGIAFKTQEIAAYFESISHQQVNTQAIEALMYMQFYAFRNVLEQGLPPDQASEAMRSIFSFFNAGWKELFSQYL